MRYLIALIATGLVATPALAHPGSGIVVDRLGQVYFVDMVSGVWKLDANGVLTHLPGQAFHWMTLDADDRFAKVRLPSGPSGDFDRIATSPTLILASDFPLVLGRDGNLYYPSRGAGTALQILRLAPSGRSSVQATLPARTARGPLQWINGLAAGPAGSLYYTEDDAIRRIGGDGTISTVVENLTVPACTSHNPLLRGLDVDSTGIVYVAATGCGAVLKVSSAGQVSVLPQVRNPWAPTGVALSGRDLVVLEFQNPDSDDRHEMLPRIRRIAADGSTTILATVARH